MLKINNLHVKLEEEDKAILKGVDLEVGAGEVHAIMGPTGSGKSTLSYVLAGRDGYEVTGGTATLDGRDLLALEPEERAAAGLFLAFQYPVEIPGVGNMNFLRTALNAQRKARGEPEVNAAEFLRLVREKAKMLEIEPDMLKRPVNVGFSGGEKKRNEILHDVDAEVLDRGVEVLLQHRGEPVDLVDEQHVAALHPRQQRSELALVLDRRAVGGEDVSAQLVTEDLGDGGLAQARRSAQEHVIERLAAPACGLHEHAQVVHHLALADELVEARGPQRAVELAVEPVGGRRHDARCVVRVGGCAHGLGSPPRLTTASAGPV
jgi:predicted ABC-type transport system involved in lysophospholipase L1 biosynthesis ATPase subunit